MNFFFEPKIYFSIKKKRIGTGIEPEPERTGTGPNRNRPNRNRTEPNRGNPELSMEIQRNRWISMDFDIYGYPCIGHGYLQTFIDMHGDPWIFMNIHGCSSMLRSKGTRMDIRTYEHTLGYPGVPRGPVPVPGFLIQKSVLPSKNQFFYPGNIFLEILIFYKKM